MKYAIMILAVCLMNSCIPEGPCKNEFARGGHKSAPSGACLIGMSVDERVYAERVLALLGRNYEGVTIEFFSAALDVTQQYKDAYMVEDDICVTGYNTSNSDIYTIPLALPHELTHTDIRDRTGWLYDGSTHSEDTYWTEEDTERVGLIKTATQNELPPASTKCE